MLTLGEYENNNAVCMEYQCQYLIIRKFLTIASAVINV